MTGPEFYNLSVDVTFVANLAIALLGLIAAFVQSRRNRDSTRGQIRQDAELLKLLPEESTSRKELLAYIDMRILSLVAEEDELVRDATGIALGIFMLLVTVTLTITSFRESGLWRLLLIPAIFFGLIGALRS